MSVKLTFDQLRQAWNETAAEGSPATIAIHPSDREQFYEFLSTRVPELSQFRSSKRTSPWNIFDTVIMLDPTITPGAIKFTSTYPGSNITVEICFDEEKC